MTFSAANLLQVLCGASALGLTLMGCGGDPFRVEDQPLVSAGSSGTGAESPTPPEGAGAVPASQPQPTPTPSGDGGASDGVPSMGGKAGVGSDDGAGAGGDGSVLPIQPVLDVIDDLEGAFPHLPAGANRTGGWYAVHDDSGGHASQATVVALEPAEHANRFAVRLDGGGFTDWGVQLGVALMSPAAAFDASKYCGLRFKAKGKPGNWSLLMSDRQSVPQGGVCNPNSRGEDRCYQFVGKTFAVTEAWQDIQVRFDELGSLNSSAGARSLDASGIYDILFNFYSAEGRDFALEVDDVAFVQSEASGCF